MEVSRVNALSESSREDAHLFFLAVGDRPHSLAFHALQVYHPDLCFCCHMAFSLCVYVFSSYEDTDYIGLGHPNDLILT